MWSNLTTTRSTSWRWLRSGPILRLVSLMATRWSTIVVYTSLQWWRGKDYNKNWVAPYLSAHHIKMAGLGWSAVQYWLGSGENFRDTDSSKMIICQSYHTGLVDLALDILATPASSVPSERMFSICGILSSGKARIIFVIFSDCFLLKEEEVVLAVTPWSRRSWWDQTSSTWMMRRIRYHEEIEREWNILFQYIA